MSKKLPEEMTLDELEAAAAEAKPDGEPQGDEKPQEKPTEEKPAEELTFTAADGTVYKGKTQEELFKQVAKAADHAKIALKERERENADLRSKVPAPPPPEEKFSQEEYLRLLAANALEAEDYLAKFDPRRKRIASAIEAGEERQRRETAINTFYKDVPDYLAVETPEIEQAFRARMMETQRPVTADALKLTYFELKQAGTIPAPPETPTKRKAPPSSATGSNGVPKANGITLAEANAMNAADLEAYILKQSAAARQQVN